MILADCLVVVVGQVVAAHRCAEILQGLGATVVEDATPDALHRADVMLGGAADLETRLPAPGTEGPVVIRFSRFGPDDRSPASRLGAIGAFHASGESQIGFERSVSTLPVAPAGRVSDVDAAQSGALAYLMIHLRRSGAGRRTRFPVIDVLSTEVGTGLNRQDIAAQTQAGREGGPDLGPLVSCSIRCADGFVVAHLAPDHRRRWLRMMRPAAPGAPAPTDEEIRDEALIPVMEEWAATRTRAQIEQLGPECGVPVCGISSLDEAVADPQLLHRGYFVTTDYGARAAPLPFLLNGRRPMPGVTRSERKVS